MTCDAALPIFTIGSACRRLAAEAMINPTLNFQQFDFEGPHADRQLVGIGEDGLNGENGAPTCLAVSTIPHITAPALTNAI